MAAQLIGAIFVPVALGLLLGGLFRLTSTLRSRGAARSAQARSLAASVATGVAGLAATVAWLTWGGPTEDIRLATLPALAGGVATLTAGVAERTWPQPSGQVRVAALTARRTVRYVGLRHLLTVGLGGTGLALLVGGLTAADDGRSFSRHAGEVTATSSPYPGWGYGSTVGIAIVLLAAATWFAQRQVDARPALGPGHEALDEALRRASLVRVLRPAASCALVTAAGLWITLGSAVNRATQNLRMNNVPGTPQSPGDMVQNLGFVGIGIGVVLFLLALLALAWNSPPLPRESPVGTGHPETARART